MKYLALFNLFFLLFTIRLQAQINIDAVSTDTIDLFNQHLTDKTSSTLPLWSTLLLPGSGHQSIGRSKSSLGYISVDVISLFCAIFFTRYGKKIIDNSRAYASLYAGVSTSVNNDEFYWQAVGNFNNYDDFHQNLKLMRDSDESFNDELHLWSWEDESFRKEFVSMQKLAKQLNTVSSFFIGAMVLNRIVAFIDLRSIIKNTRYNENAAVYFRPYKTNRSSCGLILSAEF